MVTMWRSQSDRELVTFGDLGHGYGVSSCQVYDLWKLNLGNGGMKDDCLGLGQVSCNILQLTQQSVISLLFFFNTKQLS